MPNFAHRGRGLEHAVRKAFVYYRSIGIPCHQNHALKAPGGQVTEGEPYDFEAFYGGVFFAWDAKECQGTRWPIPKKQMKQIKNLLDVQIHGGHGFFLVLFTTSEQLIRFDATIVQAALADGHGSMKPEWGVGTKIDVLGAFPT